MNTSKIFDSFNKLKFKGIFFKLMTLFCSVFIIGILFSQGILYKNASKILNDKTETMLISSFTNAINLTDKSLNEIYYIYKNITSNSLLYTDYAALNTSQKQEAIKTISEKLFLFDFIENVYCYYPKSEYVISNIRGSNKVEVLSEADKEWYNIYNENIQLPIMEQTGSNQLLTYINQYPLFVDNPELIISININKDKLFDSFTKFDNNSNIFILDEKDNLIYGLNDIYALNSDRIMISDPSIYIINSSSLTGWKYIMIPESTSFIFEAPKMLLSIFIISIILCPIMLFFCILASLKLYSPIIQMIKNLSPTVDRMSIDSKNAIRDLSDNIMMIKYENLNLKNSVQYSRGLFFYLCSGIAIDNDDIKNMLKNENFIIDSGIFQILLIDFFNSNSKSHNEDIKNINKMFIISEIKNLTSVDTTIIAEYITNNRLIILTGQETATHIDLFQILEELKTSVQVNLSLEIITGVGTSCTSVDKIYLSYFEACDMLEKNFSISKANIIEQLINIQELNSYIKNGNPKEIQKKLLDIKNSIPNSKTFDKRYFDLLWQCINLSYVTANLIKISIKKITIEEFSNHNNYKNLYDLLDFTFNTMSDVAKFANDNTTNDMNKTIEIVKNFIKTNYNKKISLTSVADMVYLTSTYLSTQFKLNTGETFIEYLIMVRIEKACELLISTNYSIDKIAQKVGYDNTRSFSRAFKSQKGITPTDFRNNKVLTIPENN